MSLLHIFPVSVFQLLQAGFAVLAIGVVSLMSREVFAHGEVLAG